MSVPVEGVVKGDRADPSGRDRVRINDVAPRDGLQIEPVFVPTADKIALVDALSHAGYAKIEVTSFTSPKAIPALADAEAVMNGIERVAGVEYVVLVPNLRGMERAALCAPDEMNLVMSVSETHNRANLRMGREASFAQLADIVRALRGTAIRANVSLSTSFGCPMEGEVPEGEVFAWVSRFAGLGVAGISLCDTTGMASPAQVARMTARFLREHPGIMLTLHFHNTRGMGLANIVAAVQAGARRFDASLGGLGGCPYAPGATGNVCSEEVVHMLELMDFDTGVDLDLALAASARLPGLLGHDVPSQLLKAGPVTRLHPVPEGVVNVG
ncbi:MAG: hydroxymethylglutaryl-CoA lyase [Betaproteobacteria bacterium]|nr:hydroxymethylglutaryl-CoA lyase [Betaproteobacteria bacterium]